MPLLFFSGGIDSVVLAFDVAQHPYRYGIANPDATALTLLTVSSKKRDAEKQLKPILTSLHKVSRIAIAHEVQADGLYTEAANQLPLGGAPTINPYSVRVKGQILATPYTAGWLLWMGAVAMNRLYGEDESYNPAQAFIAHQWDGPTWEAYDKGQFSGFDSSPEFYENLNRTIKTCRERVMVRAPFVENRMNKAMVVQLGLEVGAPLELTSSCIYGWKTVCGQCFQCLIRQAAFKSLGIKYA